MRRRRGLIGVAISVAVSALTATALADLAPGPGPARDPCNLYAHPDRDCRYCAAWHSEPDKCAPLADEGLVRVCRTAGASVWKELWCRGEAPIDRADAAPTPVPDGGTSSHGASSPPSERAEDVTAVPPLEKKPGCGACTVGDAPGDPGGALVLGAASALALGARRRRLTRRSRGRAGRP
ncbi:MAG: MYXO-CTERM sorting domain-containing protein [Sorangiineae bacterium]|nr:MYXO-CTERM sorting domain-containing protein [Polyangiaceae bacterium]MEB2324192.1 MYXO-CTERM sorting domain-containing protein [Sorangiineae bacterium]